MSEPLAVQLILAHLDIGIFELMDKTGQSAEEIIDIIGYKKLNPNFRSMVFDGSLKFHQIWGLSQLGSWETQLTFWNNYHNLDPKDFHVYIRRIAQISKEIQFVKAFSADPALLVKMGFFSEEQAKTIMHAFIERYPRMAMEIRDANL